MIDSGKMDRLISIEQEVTVSENDYGERVKEWQVFQPTWAKKEDISGLEKREGAQEVARGKVVWTIYFMEGVKETMRISYEGEIYQIEHIKEIGYREGLEIITERKDND